VNISDFAKRYHLPLQTDSNGIQIVKGISGFIYQYSVTELGVVIFPGRPRSSPTSRRGRYIFHTMKCYSLGMKLRQDCDGEGAMSFNPNKRRQARMAIEVAKIRPANQTSRSSKARGASSRVEQYPRAWTKCPLNDSPETELGHQHNCDVCDSPFLCEGRHWEPWGKQVCEESEIASGRSKAVANREQLSDCIDDQAVIEQIKLRVAQEVAFESSQGENDNRKPWGGLFSSATRSSREYAPKYSKPVLRRRVCD
jgi:hypothetical protein